MAGMTTGWAVAGSVADLVAEPRSDRLGGLLPTRPLGRTGVEVTALGLGGAHHAMYPSDREAEAMIEVALENGVRFFDSAHMYSRGRSEARYGAFLVPKYRDVAFVMSKSAAVDATSVKKEFETSLKRLKCDSIDLYQIHGIQDPEDVDRRLDHGVLDALLEEKGRGRIRFIGFTGHHTPAAHLRMLERLDQLGIRLDTCQMPVNVVDPGYESFILEVLPKLVAGEYGVLGMKSLAYGQLLGKQTSWVRGRGRQLKPIVPEKLSISEALHFVWSLPVSCLISGMKTEAELKENIGHAKSWTAMTEEERTGLIDRVADASGPDLEFYKTDRVSRG